MFTYMGLLYVSLKYIFVGITSFVGTPKSMRMLYKYYTHNSIVFHTFQCISGLMTLPFLILNVNILTMQELAINNKTYTVCPGSVRTRFFFF
jgi:hypothetical protein